MNRTPIEWCRTYNADGSFEEGFSVNPVRFRPRGSQKLVTMCQRVSPGCQHCYAERLTRRFWPKDAEDAFHGYNAVSLLTGDFVLDEKTLLSVLKRKKPARIFWGDMTDLFQESVPDAFLDRCFAVCALTPHLTHMFLTKRPERMLAYCGNLNAANLLMLGVGKLVGDLIGDDGFSASRITKLLEVHAVGADQDSETVSLTLRNFPWPLPNVWLGTSVESQEYADKRIPLLLQTPAAVRFISAEPLLGSVDMARYIAHWECKCGAAAMPLTDDTECKCEKPYEDEWSLVQSGTYLDWVIVGGESGAGARPMHPDWPRSLREQCKDAGVPYFFKQWGEWLPLTDYDPFIHGMDTDKYAHQFAWRAGAKNESELPISCYHVGKKAAGALLDGVEYREFPEVRV